MRLAAVFNVKSGQFLKDLMLGPKLITKGKLKMFQSKNKNMPEIERSSPALKRCAGTGKRCKSKDEL